MSWLWVQIPPHPILFPGVLVGSYVYSYQGLNFLVESYVSSYQGFNFLIGSYVSRGLRS
jgi:hypothetical protein